ncbi:MAG: class I SAM-dependent methyltransferase [Candidatus Melainabacteria bacterium]|nr:class I SAM-dependent methyltransferase [Candidatus Melainabacteria bacterium]
MDLQGIRHHWQTWAKEYGTDLRATTKGVTAKALEVDALSRCIESLYGPDAALKVLEVGCGNGTNCFKLLERFPKSIFTGLDFVPEMIESAKSVKSEIDLPDDRITFDVANVMELPADLPIYDLIITDRLLINLNTTALQVEAIGKLAQHIKHGGHLLMIENSTTTYDRQNRAREAVALPARRPYEFNLFFDEKEIIAGLAKANLELVDTEDFISLHDLVLYVLVPMTNGGVVDYDHPIVKAATDLSIAVSAEEKNSFGTYGQNRLFKCRKLAAD